jgi:hypothetical protein
MRIGQEQGMSGATAEKRVYTSLASSVRRIFAEEGVLGMYKGVSAALVRVIPVRRRRTQ